MPLTLGIRRLGQIQNADIIFGDLTVFVGPQATGKSIVLQLLKLLLDAGQIQEELQRYGLDWGRKLPEFLDVYFGEGMRSIWKAGETDIQWHGGTVDFGKLASHKRKTKKESLFFIPAQRVLALRDGWPRPFTDYASGDPFAVREFSEHLRRFVEHSNGDGSAKLFPMPGKMKAEFRDLLQKHVFANFDLQIDKVHSQKRLVLNSGGDSVDSLPYMVWSAGQREFVPLLLGLYSIMPAQKASRNPDLEWVVLEELEMGLHPRAISVVILLVFELLRRGYRVCLSTHSPQVLDAIWAVRQLRNFKANSRSLLEVFGVDRSQAMEALAREVMQKTYRVHYFDPSGNVRDISDLDPISEIEGEHGFGGLSEFSGRANAAVAHAAANPAREDKT